MEHIIAAKAVAFKEAQQEQYIDYTKKVVENAKIMANEFLNKGYKIISNGTDNHCLLIDLRNKNINGKEAEFSLGLSDITVNKNMVPFDPKSPFVTSGIRIGSPAMTTRGMGVEEVKIVVDLIDQVILNHDNEENIQSVKKQVNELCSSFPIYE